MIKSIDKKREHINSALKRHPISSDTRFVSTISHLIQNDNNLDSVIADLNDYRQSFSSQQKTTERWINDSIRSWKHSLFVTFTFQYQKSPKVSNILFEQFYASLNKTVYKNAFRRNNKKCSFFVVSEGGIETETRQHFHAVFELPIKETFEEFKATIENLWIHGSVDLRMIEDNKDAVIGYLLKRKTKTSQNLLEHF